jgi:hypothetical protein
MQILSDFLHQFDVLRVHLEGCTASERVFFEIKADIYGISVLEMRGFVSLPESDTIHRYQTVCDIEMEMLAFAHGTRVAVVDQIAAKEERSLIAGTERFEALKDLVHLPIHLREFHFGFDVQGRYLLLGFDVRGDIFFEPALELRQVCFVHTQTGSELMSSEVCEQIPTGVDSGIDIEIADRTGTSADDVIVSGGKDDCGSIEGLRETTCGYSHYAFMPIGRKDHSSEFARIHRIFFELLQGFVGRFGVIIASVLIV